MLGQIINQTREKAPLIHNITSYVVANDCANITLACGAYPIMAEDLNEVKEVTSIAAALVINTGILTEGKLSAMLVAGKKANVLAHPVILDPVGAGVSKLRTYAILRLIKELSVQVIRGNSSEIKKLYEIYSMNSGTLRIETGDNPTIVGTLRTEADINPVKGVDVADMDIITKNNLDFFIMAAKELAGYTGAIIVMTGAIDIITDGTSVRLVHNGNAMLKLVTGSGCMLSSVVGAYCGANPKGCMEACVAAVGAMGLCGEYAYEKILHKQEGSASFRIYLIDFMSQLDGDRLMQGIRLEER
jgi:hydroxyethylthiazole kinase